jgi:hypothetical protein
VPAVSELHRGRALGVALRRAYGAALYLEPAYPGIAGRVDVVVGTLPADDVWTSRDWMAFSIVVRRVCLELPPVDDRRAHAAVARRALERQLGRALDEAHAALVAEQRRRWASPAGDGPHPDSE